MHPKLRPALAALLLTLPAWAGSMASVSVSVGTCNTVTDDDSSLTGMAIASVSESPFCSYLPDSSGGATALASPGLIRLSANVDPRDNVATYYAYMTAQSTSTVFIPGPQIGWFETNIRLAGIGADTGEGWTFSGPGFNFVGDPFLCGSDWCEQSLSFLSDPMAIPVDGQSFLFSIAGNVGVYDNQSRPLVRQASLDVQFHPLPEPASGALLLIGTIGLLLRRASHKSSRL
ncbi:MAG: PEP-CTERM sorting domain-containing protein [Bryobacterales bacterium]|nr:PEP-CTERM sorting domain-containing protein [Bryobacterales bacterium]